jgi:hypothetical protein
LKAQDRRFAVKLLPRNFPRALQSLNDGFLKLSKSNMFVGKNERMKNWICLLARSFRCCVCAGSLEPTAFDS